MHLMGICLSLFINPVRMLSLFDSFRSVCYLTLTYVTPSLFFVSLCCILYEYVYLCLRTLSVCYLCLFHLVSLVFSFWHMCYQPYFFVSLCCILCEFVCLCFLTLSVCCLFLARVVCPFLILERHMVNASRDRGNFVGQMCSFLCKILTLECTLYTLRLESK